MAVSEAGSMLAAGSGLGRQARDRIMAAATIAFAERGFNGVTIRDLAQRAGVNLAAVNYHFRSKEDLYAAVIETALAQWTSETIAASDLAAGASLATVVRMIVSALIAPVIERESNHLLPRLLAWDLLQRPTAGMDASVTSCMTVIQKALAPFLPQKMTGDRSEFVARWLVSQCLLLSPSLAGKQQSGRIDLVESEKLAEQVAAMALAGLVAIIAECGSA
jgi:TetR/AcrR family transcriptional regulator, regulator of cefoperazone and chloramphenicol sensitivity